MNGRLVCFLRDALSAGLMATLLGGAPYGIAVGAATVAAPPAVASPPAVALQPAVASSPAPPSAALSPSPTPAAAGPDMPSEDIRDIRGPKYVLPPWLLPALLAGVVLLALGAYGAWRWRRRRRQPRALLPFEAALQRLEEIRVLMQPANAREFSTAVSDIVRRYIEQRFGVTATHSTTEEFLRDLLQSSNPSLARHRGLLSEFLHQCDLVKFAAMSLSTQSMESLHQSARAFVLETAKPDEVTAIGKPLQSPMGQETHDSLPST
jgi:hypothetical protein